MFIKERLFGIKKKSKGIDSKPSGTRVTLVPTTFVKNFPNWDSNNPLIKKIIIIE